VGSSESCETTGNNSPWVSLGKAGSLEGELYGIGFPRCEA
jgi:hypothetical protein